MAIPNPSAVALDAATLPSWAGTVQTAINAALASPLWAGGARTRNVSLAAAQFGVAGVSSAVFTSLLTLLNEYRAGGWRVRLVGSAMDAQQQVTSVTFEFARFPDDGG